ncbi:MAG: CDGSH iron-sulfur domain-containing protein [Nitrososphaeraceae archaeon]
MSPNRYSSTYKPDKEPKVVENLVNSKDGKLSKFPGIALCRCEASKNKLFCDESHLALVLKMKKTNTIIKV